MHVRALVLAALLLLHALLPFGGAAHAALAALDGPASDADSPLRRAAARLAKSELMPRTLRVLRAILGDRVVDARDPAAVREYLAAAIADVRDEPLAGAFRDALAPDAQDSDGAAAMRGFLSDGRVQATLDRGARFLRRALHSSFSNDDAAPRMSDPTRYSSLEDVSPPQPLTPSPAPYSSERHIFSDAPDSPRDIIDVNCPDGDAACLRAYAADAAATVFTLKAMLAILYFGLIRYHHTLTAQFTTRGIPFQQRLLLHIIQLGMQFSVGVCLALIVVYLEGGLLEHYREIPYWPLMSSAPAVFVTLFDALNAASKHIADLQAGRVAQIAADRERRRRLTSPRIGINMRPIREYDA